MRVDAGSDMYFYPHPITEDSFKRRALGIGISSSSSPHR